MKKWPYLLIVAGILIFLFPTSQEWYYEWKQEQLLKSMEQGISPTGEANPESSLQAGYERLSQLFAQEPSAEVQEMQPEQVPLQAVSEPVQSQATSTSNQQAGTLIMIDKINLKLPILEGASQENMKFAAAHMTETTPLGEVGNAAIAAHRVRTKGRLFNRLDELEIGDKIIVQIKDKQMVYTVYKTLVVEPTDISVLKSNNKDSVLTLITCDPIVNPTHRLIVHAKL